MTTADPTRLPLAAARRVLIVHGFGATLDDHWFPWLAAALPRAERIALPNPLSPEARAWVPRVADAIARLGEGTAVVAHSLGNATALQALRRLRTEGRAIELAAFVAVAPFAAPLPATGVPELDMFRLGDSERGPGQRAFLDELDLPALRPHLGAVRVIRSDDDPLVPAPLSDQVAAGWGAHTEVVPGAGHFLATDGVLELPLLLAEPQRSA